jgi:hypothetical protein
VKVKAESDGSLDALLGGLGNLPGVGGLDSALSQGGGGGLSGLLSGGAVGGATKLAVAGGAIAGSFTLAATSVGTFVERTKEVDRLSATIGETAEETSRLLVVMKRYGAEARDVGDALLNIQSKAADGSLGDFGVELDADGSALDNLDRIIEAYGRIESNADKAALASAAFGEEGARQFVPIISKGADEWERLRAAVDGGQIIDDEAIAKGERLAEIGRDLGGRWESLKISIGGFFADLLSNIDKAAKAIDEGPIGDAFNKGIEIFGSPLGPEEDQPGFTAGKGTLVGDVPDDLGKAADGAIRLGGELEEAKTQAELLEEATARVKDQINSAIDPFADLAAGDQGVASAVEGLDAQRDALTSINDKIDEAKGKQAELREQLAETDDVAAKAAEGRTQVAKDSAKAAADAEDSRAKAVEDAARRIAEVQAKEAQDAAGAQARLAALTRQRNVLAADGDDPEKVRDLDNQIAVTRRDMAAAKTEAAATIAETNRTLGEQQADIAASSAKGDAAYAEQVAKIDQAQSASNAKSAEALAKINATEAEGLAKAAERRAKLEADLAELGGAGGHRDPGRGAPRPAPRRDTRRDSGGVPRVGNPRQDRHRRGGRQGRPGCRIRCGGRGRRRADPSRPGPRRDRQPPRIPEGAASRYWCGPVHTRSVRRDHRTVADHAGRDRQARREGSAGSSAGSGAQRGQRRRRRAGRRVSTRRGEGHRHARRRPGRRPARQAHRQAARRRRRREDTGRRRRQGEGRHGRAGSHSDGHCGGARSAAHPRPARPDPGQADHRDGQRGRRAHVRPDEPVRVAARQLGRRHDARR